MDKPLERLELLGRLYRPNSSVVWNGTKASTLPDIGALLARLPPSRTDIADLDAHPVGGSSPPRILVHVQGHVRHASPGQLVAQGSASAGAFTSRLVALHTPLMANPDPSAAADPSKPNWVPVPDIPQPPHAVGPPEVPDFDVDAHRRSSKGKDIDQSKIDSAPRWFSQTFLLAAENENAGAEVQPKVGRTTSSPPLRSWRHPLVLHRPGHLSLCRMNSSDKTALIYDQSSVHSANPTSVSQGSIRAEARARALLTIVAVRLWQRSPPPPPFSAAEARPTVEVYRNIGTRAHKSFTEIMSQAPP